MQLKRLTFAAVFAAVLFSMALTSCSQKNAEQSSEKPEGVIPQAQLDALNKAKNVENVLKQSDQQRREQSEAAQ